MGKTLNDLKPGDPVLLFDNRTLMIVKVQKVEGTDYIEVQVTDDFSVTGWPMSEVVKSLDYTFWADPWKGLQQLDEIFFPPEVLFGLIVDLRKIEDNRI